MKYLLLLLCSACAAQVSPEVEGSAEAAAFDCPIPVQLVAVNDAAQLYRLPFESCDPYAKNFYGCDPNGVDLGVWLFDIKKNGFGLALELDYETAECNSGVCEFQAQKHCTCAGCKWTCSTPACRSLKDLQ